MSDEIKIHPESIYTIGAAARLLNVSPSTLRDLERRGHVACSRTPGLQRRFAGSELLRLQDEANRVPSRATRPTSSTGAVVTEDVKVRQAWLGSLIVRAQRELPVDTPAGVRLRLGADLERALRNAGPASPLADVEPVVKRQIEQAKHQVQEAQEQAQRREIKDQMLEYAQAYLRRSIKDLPRRVVGAPDSLKRRHVRATLRDLLHDRLQKRLQGNEDWNLVRDLVDELLAAWYVGETPGLRIPDTVKILAAGVTGVVGGAAAAAALDPRVRAAAAKFKDPFLLLAVNFLKRFNAPPPSATPNPTNQTTTPAPSGPSTGLVGVSWPAYRRAPTARRGYSAPGRMMAPAYRGAPCTPQRGES